jgi:hypothetical protein
MYATFAEFSTLRTTRYSLLVELKDVRGGSRNLSLGEDGSFEASAKEHRIQA